MNPTSDRCMRSSSAYFRRPKKKQQQQNNNNNNNTENFERKKKVMTYYLVVHTGPEWCNSTKYHFRDVPFWSETLEMQLIRLLLSVGCLKSQQQASVSQGRICSHNFTCCHTEIEVADPAFYLTQSQYTDAGPTSPSADPISPDAWQGSHWSANF